MKYISLIVVLISFSCREMPSKVTNQIEGLYIYEFEDGKIEYLDVEAGRDYTKLVFSDRNSVKTGYVSYCNRGRWSVGKNEKEISFNNWLSLCEWGNPLHMLDKPRNIGRGLVFWYPENNKHEDFLAINLDAGYVFRKVDSVDASISKKISECKEGVIPNGLVDSLTIVP